MATFTSFLNLRKPAASDNINVTLDLSDNFEAIDAAIESLDSRLDTSEQAGKLLDYVVLSADENGTVGNINIMETTGFALTTERKLKIDYKIMFGVAGADTGIFFALQRQINGGAWVDVETGKTWTIKPTTAFTDFVSSSAFDLGPSSAGVVGTGIKYRMNCQAVGTNGQSILGANISFIAIYDAGPI